MSCSVNHFTETGAKTPAIDHSNPAAVISEEHVITEEPTVSPENNQDQSQPQADESIKGSQADTKWIGKEAALIGDSVILEHLRL